MGILEHIFPNPEANALLSGLLKKVAFDEASIEWLCDELFFLPRLTSCIALHNDAFCRASVQFCTLILHIRNILIFPWHRFVNGVNFIKYSSISSINLLCSIHSYGLYFVMLNEICLHDSPTFRKTILYDSALSGMMTEFGFIVKITTVLTFACDLKLA